MPTGIWLIGGRGSVAATSVAGALAIRAGLVPPTGCVTELPELRGAVLPAFGDLVFGGHDPASIPLDKKAEALATAGVPRRWLPRYPATWPRSTRRSGRCRPPQARPGPPSFSSPTWRASATGEVSTRWW